MTAGGSFGERGWRCTDDEVIVTDSLTTSNKGQAEHQKITQAAALPSFGAASGIQLDSHMKKFSFYGLRITV